MPRIEPYSELPQEVIAKYQDKRKATGQSPANWLVDGGNPTWQEVGDHAYGLEVRHIGVLDPHGEIIFDKANFIQRGVFALPIRLTPQRRAEFYLSYEKRMLFKDKDGNQGDNFIYNIPQGSIGVHETPSDAASREVEEETGHKPTSLTLVGNIGLDIPNSESLNPFYIAFINRQVQGEFTLDDTEYIDRARGGWFSWMRINAMDLYDSKTMIALYLAQRVLHPKLLR